MVVRIAFAGSIGTGKSVCSNYLKEKYGGEVHSLASPMKKMAKEFFGTDDKSDFVKIEVLHKHKERVRGRDILIRLGDGIRKYDPKFWVRLFETNIKHNHSNIFVDDLRYKNEETMLKNNGFVIVQLFCKDHLRKIRISERGDTYKKEYDNAPSEKGGLILKPDYRIYNNGDIHILQQQLDDIYRAVKNRED